MMLNNKRGMELPQGVIVVAIIVLVVLVVVLAFFAGGFGQIGDRLKGLFSAGVDDQATAVSFCNSYCDSVKNFDSEESVRGSAYCTKWFKLDKNNDGKADKNSDGKVTRYYCGTEHQQDTAADSGSGIGVECPEKQFRCI